MDIQHQSSENEGSFYIENNGQNVGEMRYSLNGNTIEIFHTEVDPEHQGKNLGLKLVEAGVNYAREKNYKIVPSCTFAKTVFAGHQSYQDVLA
jgi:predicted GNAT family acetyltransferase